MKCPGKCIYWVYAGALDPDRCEYEKGRRTEKAQQIPGKKCLVRRERILREEKAQLLRALSLGIKYEKMDKKALQKYGREVRRAAVKAVDGKGK